MKSSKATPRNAGHTRINRTGGSPDGVILGQRGSSSHVALVARSVRTPWAALPLSRDLWQRAWSGRDLGRYAPSLEQQAHVLKTDDRSGLQQGQAHQCHAAGREEGGG